MAVLHRNNMRDAVHDARRGTTLAILLGPCVSAALFRALLMLAPLSGSFAMMYSSSPCPAASAAITAAAAALLALVGMRLTSNVIAKEPVAQPQDVAEAAGTWAVCYLVATYLTGAACIMQNANPVQ
jgi:1,4-dihydroxy-2-naphthoate octaprenyltransferase